MHNVASVVPQRYVVASFNIVPNNLKQSLPKPLCISRPDPKVVHFKT